MHKIHPNNILVTNIIDPDWEPIMKRASTIVTNRGGTTFHASMITSKMGIPAVVGCINATSKIKTDDKMTLSCAEGDTNFIYVKALDFTVTKS